VLLDKAGYIKVTDFGLSKTLLFEDEKANTICGTP
jgi:serine/threonine protein kinase